MANRAYIIPVRSDLSGVVVPVFDLKPHNPQKNNVYDGEGQTHYLAHFCDRPGTTTVSGNAYVSGSINTAPLGNLSVVDTDGNAANDASVTASAEFGLLAYLRERVHVNPAADSDVMTSGEAVNVYADIVAAVQAGNPLTVAAINTILNARLAGADNSLDGTDGAGGAVAGSNSFGYLEDILAMLAGAVYRTKANTILADNAGAFLGYVGRTALVDAATGTYFAQGGFLTRGEAGFRSLPTVVRDGSLNISAGEGVLAGLKQSVAFKSPNRAYTAGTVSLVHPRAVNLVGTAIPESGSAPVVRVYDSLGNPL